MDPATPDPKISDEALAACAEKIKPYLEAAAAFGIAPRPITGLMLRLGESLGVDIGAVGQVSDAEGDPNAYYDDIMKAVWVLSENDDVLSACALGEKSVESALLAWKLKHLVSQKAETAAMRAFVGRWIEHRLEMAHVFGVEAGSGE